MAAYREALKEQSQDRASFDWASTQNNLGVALTALGQREGGTAKLVAAVSAYREALKIFSRERAPLPSAMTERSGRYAHSSWRARRRHGKV